MFDSGVGQELAAELAAADVGTLDAAAALALAAAAQRLAGWTASVRLAAATRLAELRPVAEDDPVDHPDPVVGCSSWAVDELAATLTCGRGQARTEIDRGQQLAQLPATAALLHRADHRVQGNAGSGAGPVAGRDREGRPRRPDGVSAGRPDHRADPPGRRPRRAGDRPRRGGPPPHPRPSRPGVRFTPDPDNGMTRMTADLDPADGTRLEQRLRHLAEAARVPGDTRTLAQRMLQALLDLALLNPHTRQPDGRPTSTTTDGRTSEDAEQDWADPDEAGHDEVTAAAVPGSGCRHTVDTPVVIHVTVSADTLLGRDHEPGHLAGYGPIDAALARRLAHEPHATWRRILTDPVTGAVLDVGRTAYRPPARLHRHVRTRDQTCRFPGCLRDAHRCHQDHTFPFAAGGLTAEHNLGELCPHHHRLKHHAGWQLRQPAPGTFEWTTPTGSIRTVMVGD